MLKLRDWFSPWYVVYVLFGALAVGIVPILIPLSVSSAGAGSIGIIMAALNIGGLFAGGFGFLCDRYRLHRAVVLSGLGIVAVAIGLFPEFPGLLPRVVLALLAGTGMAAVSTVANLLIVEVYPKEQWDSRIGWFQTFYGIGQVAGLLLAGLFSSRISEGLLITSAIGAAALIVAAYTVRTPRKPPVPVRAKPAVIRHGEWAISSPGRAHHNVSMHALRNLKSIFSSQFGIFLIGWLFVYTGATGIFSLYPVLYQSLFKVSPVLSSAGFAVAAAAGLFLYAPSGRLSDRIGTLSVLNASVLIRILAFLCLWILTFFPAHSTGAASLLVFGVIVLAWSPISVSSVAFTAASSSLGEGEAMGLYNAASGAAAIAGSLAGGGIAAAAGYRTVPLLAAGLLSIGLFINVRFLKTPAKRGAA
ncbi:MAG: MFS transporter [Deltaproteobacteria bacterium]|nr:MFS transporter [Deltaproteobacteria bacterium]